MVDYSFDLDHLCSLREVRVLKLISSDRLADTLYSSILQKRTVNIDALTCTGDKADVVIKELIQAKTILSAVQGHVQDGIYFSSFFPDSAFADTLAGIYSRVETMVDPSSNNVVTTITCDNTKAECTSSSASWDEARQLLNLCDLFFNDNEVFDTEYVMVWLPVHQVRTDILQ